MCNKREKIGFYFMATWVCCMLVVLMFQLTSCGTRRTETNRYKLDVDSISVNNERVLSQSQSFNKIYRVKPFDSSKPFEIDGKKYFNASIEFDNSIVTKYEDKKADSKLDYKKKEDEKEKKTERKDNTILYIGLAFLALLFSLVLIKKPY